MNAKLVVLSMDAMVGEDLEYLQTRPNYRRLFKACARVGGVRTIYPSITYPAHVSVVTGCRAGRHGVDHNTAFKPADKSAPDWLLYADAIKTDDLFSAAKRAGRTTAAIFWPVTGNHPDIDYLIDEFVDHFMPGVAPLDAFRRLGSNEAMLDVVKRNMYRYPVDNAPKSRADDGIRIYNTADHFLTGCACDIIKRYKPDLTLVHNCYLDYLRHRYGAFSPNIQEGLDLTDMWLGELIDALQAAGVYDETDFVLMSDHGQLDFTRRLRLNTKLVRDGWITCGEDGAVTRYSMITKSTGMSVYVYLDDPSDEKTREAAYAYLQGLAREGVWGFDEVFTANEVQARYGLSGDFSFVLETDGYTAFSDAWEEPICNPVDYSDYRLGQATHGYLPEKGPQPVFVAAGPHFKPGAYIETTSIINEGPTFAHILGARLNDAEGRCLDELMR